IVGNLASPVRLRQIKAGEGIILTQRISSPVFRHQDTAQVWMISKDNTKEIVYLTLVPVCPRPHPRYAWQLGMIFAALTYAYFQPQITLVWDREKLIDDIEARDSLGPVNRSHGLKEGELQIFLQEGAHLKQVFRLKNNRLLTTKLDRFNDGLRE